jgi:hypothetical protein
MNWFNTLTVLIVVYLVVILQATFSELRHWIGVQIDLLPSLIVYISLSSGIVTLSLAAIFGGLWLDSLSANPFGASVLPLFLTGFFIHGSRDYILRQQVFAQRALGALASAAVPVLTLLLLANAEVFPVVGWFSLWQGVVLMLAGAIMTPLWFALFHRLGHALSYRPITEPSFRPDRQIKRGRRQ